MPRIRKPRKTSHLDSLLSSRWNTATFVNSYQGDFSIFTEKTFDKNSSNGEINKMVSLAKPSYMHIRPSEENHRKFTASDSWQLQKDENTFLVIRPSERITFHLAIGFSK